MQPTGLRHPGEDRQGAMQRETERVVSLQERPADTPPGTQGTLTAGQQALSSGKVPCRVHAPPPLTQVNLNPEESGVSSRGLVVADHHILLLAQLLERLMHPRQAHTVAANNGVVYPRQALRIRPCAALL